MMMMLVMIKWRYSHHGNGIREDYDDNHAEEDMMIKIDVLIP